MTRLVPHPTPAKTLFRRMKSKTAKTEHRNIHSRNKRKSPANKVVCGTFHLVRVTGFEPAASSSQTYRENFFCSFIAIFSHFQPFSICFTYFLTLLSPLFPGVPAPYVVIYVVKNASRPVSGEDSPVPDGKRFAFQTVCIVTLSRVLCKWFL